MGVSASDFRLPSRIRGSLPPSTESPIRAKPHSIHLAPEGGEVAASAPRQRGPPARGHPPPPAAFRPPAAITLPPLHSARPRPSPSTRCIPPARGHHPPSASRPSRPSRHRALFDRDALGEVARLIDVVAAGERD